MPNTPPMACSGDQNKARVRAARRARRDGRDSRRPPGAGTTSRGDTERQRNGGRGPDRPERPSDRPADRVPEPNGNREAQRGQPRPEGSIRPDADAPPRERREGEPRSRRGGRGRGRRDEPRTAGDVTQTSGPVGGPTGGETADQRDQRRDPPAPSEQPQTRQPQAHQTTDRPAGGRDETDRREPRGDDRAEPRVQSRLDPRLERFLAIEIDGAQPLPPTPSAVDTAPAMVQSEWTRNPSGRADETPAAVSGDAVWVDTGIAVDRGDAGGISGRRTTRPTARQRR